MDGDTDPAAVGSYDAIVVGLGGMGSATAMRLARRGCRVLGVERFTRAHDRGSSHGLTRMVRQAYFERPDYVPLILRAYALWDELSLAAGKPALTRTGGLTIGPPDARIISGARASAERWELAHELLDAPGIRSRFPTMTVGDDEIALYEAAAGFVRPEETVALQCALAEQAGAELRFETSITSWSSRGDGVEVVLGGGERVSARALVLSAGAWTSELAPGLPIPLTAERHVQYWFELDDPGAWEVGRAPGFLWEFAPGEHFYGFPAVDGDALGLKVAFFHRGRPTDPDRLRREVGDDEIDAIRSCIAPRLAGVGPRLLRAEPCLYTMTPDEQFIVDRHPEAPNCIVLAGFSGHGFKFVPVIGEIAAELVLDGDTRHPIDAFSLDSRRRRLTAPGRHR